MKKLNYHYVKNIRESEAIIIKAQTRSKKSSTKIDLNTITPLKKISMKKSKLFLVLLFCLMLSSCKSNNTYSTEKNKTTDKTKTMNDNMKFKLSAINDPLITKGEAILFLLPEGWNYEAKIDWDFSNNVAPSNPHGYFYNANKSVQYYSMPTYFFMQMTQMLAMSGMHAGSKYLGCTLVANGFGNAIIATQDLLKKTNALPNGTKIISAKSVPIQSQNPADIAAQQANPQVKVISESVILEGEYYSNNEKYNVYVVAYVGGINNPQLSFVSWTIRPEIVIIKDDAQRKKNESLLAALYKSFRATKNYMSCAQQVSQMLSNNFYTGVRQAGAISQQISRNNDAMIASIDAQYTQANNSASGNNGFNDYIKGVENYADGNGYQYELPSSYSHAWKNGNGEIILSNEHGYDPNIGSTQSWQELSK